MKTPIAFFSMLLVTGSAFADPYVMAKERAHETADQNNAEQTRIQRAANATDTTQPVNPALQATMQNVGDLQTDFSNFINAQGPPGAILKNALLSNLSEASQGTKASGDSVKKLGGDLVNVLAQRKTLTQAQLKSLAVDIHALFNSSHLSAAQQKTMFDGVQKILTEAGVSADDATGIVTDLKKIADETK